MNARSPMVPPFDSYLMRKRKATRLFDETILQYFEEWTKMFPIATSGRPHEKNGCLGQQIRGDRFKAPKFKNCSGYATRREGRVPCLRSGSISKSLSLEIELHCPQPMRIGNAPRREQKTWILAASAKHISSFVCFQTLLYICFYFTVFGTIL